VCSEDEGIPAGHSDVCIHASIFGRKASGVFVVLMGDVVQAITPSQLRFTLVGAGRVDFPGGRGVSNTTMISTSGTVVMLIWLDHVLIRNYNYPRIDSLCFIGRPNRGKALPRGK
jgi:hypothetical protein